MKAVILAGGLGTRISEETAPAAQADGRDRRQADPLAHHEDLLPQHGINDFVICLGYKGYMIKEYFANYFLHMSDVTFDMATNRMEVHQNNAEPWR
jgi:glucose-1-phosphate cytidylyltransferase